MAVKIDVTTTGDAAYTKMLKSAGPRRNPRIMSLALRQIGLLTQSIAAREKIRPGGRSKPLPHALTSRTGRGRDSIRTDFSRLPGEVSVGSDLGYMAAHEDKKTAFAVKASTVSAHTRKVAFGRRVKPFKVPRHTRKAHTIKLPHRPWLEPAVDAVVPKRAEAIVAKNWQERLGVL